MTTDQRNDLRRKVNELDITRVYQFTRSPKAGLNMYVCPICGSGNGSDHTGALQISKDGRPQRITCYAGKCFTDKGQDVLGALRTLWDCNEEGVFRELYERGFLPEYGNISQSRKTPGNAPERPKNEEKKKVSKLQETMQKLKERANKDDYTQYYLKCKKELEQSNISSLRGIPKEILLKHYIGLEKDGFKWKDETGKWQSATALVIPSSRDYYTKRAFPLPGEATPPQRYKNPKDTHPKLFNPKAIESEVVFVCEGAINALTLEALGYNALAIGSTSNIYLLVEAIDRLKTSEKVRKNIVFALDPDESGAKATKELKNELKDSNISFDDLLIYQKPKEGEKPLDINDLYTRNEETRRFLIDQCEAVFEREAEERELYQKNYSAFGKMEIFEEGVKESANTEAIATGYSLLDEEILEGGLFEGLITIGACSSLGKTTFALQMCDQIAQRGRDCLIFSLEMAESELIAKSLSRLTYLELDNLSAQNYSRIRSNIQYPKTTRGILQGSKYKFYDDLEIKLIEMAKTKYKTYADHIFIKEGNGLLNVHDIRKGIERHILYTGNIPVILIDYLQILAPYIDPKHPGKTFPEKQSVDLNIMELKQISRDFKAPIIVISSLNRENYDKKISFQALKQSGGIEYGSDLVIGLQFDIFDKDNGQTPQERIEEQMKSDEREIELKILKNRNGQTARTLKMKFNPKFNYFQEEYIK